MKKLTKRQQLVMEILEELAINGTLAISDPKLASILFVRKKMSGYNGCALHHTSIRRFLLALKDAGRIAMESSRGKKERIIKLEV